MSTLIFQGENEEKTFPDRVPLYNEKGKALLKKKKYIELDFQDPVTIWHYADQF